MVISYDLLDTLLESTFSIYKVIEVSQSEGSFPVCKRDGLAPAKNLLMSSPTNLQLIQQ